MNNQPQAYLKQSVDLTLYVRARYHYANTPQQDRQKAEDSTEPTLKDCCDSLNIPHYG